ncbi:hypothetical protein [Streptomyces agglomeratus]|uniref:hypothetical protein n=1 Tax=Streptomyces agglomeratus TaxID=285458 RepID=UPI00114D0C86|nr:hypothetical protein [Streptomyces agglomeratus]
MNGASIPQYTPSGGDVRPSRDDDELSIWQLLYTDPWYELRLLGLAEQPRGHTRLGQEPNSQIFIEEMMGYTPDQEVLDRLFELGLCDYFEQALTDLRDTPEIQEAAQTAPAGAFEHRHIAARALLARTMTYAETNGLPPLDGSTRDALLATLSTDLHGEARAFGWVSRIAKRSAVAWAGDHLTRRRGFVTDAVVPAVGDILLYQARGARIRRLVRKSIEHIPGNSSITVIAHSLGGIACVDLLVQHQMPRVHTLVTVGSQASFLYEIGALSSLRTGDPLPTHFPSRWLNVYDERDVLSYVVTPIFPRRAYDQRVDNKQPFPQAHSAYWNNVEFWEVVEPWLR